jgi:hypothetical protein
VRQIARASSGESTLPDDERRSFCLVSDRLRYVHNRGNMEILMALDRRWGI